MRLFTKLQSIVWLFDGKIMSAYKLLVPLVRLINPLLAVQMATLPGPEEMCSVSMQKFLLKTLLRGSSLFGVFGTIHSCKW